MKRFVLTACLGMMAFMAFAQVPSQDRGISVMFWNLENFFDWKDGGNSDSDGEFSTKGEKRWSSRRFYAKCDAVAKTLLWVADEYDGVPDIFAVAEVENRDVLRRLVDHTILYKYNYDVVHADSPDPRGIDVGLIYRKDRLRLENRRTVHISQFATRDILEATFTTEDGVCFSLLVNHHPSKYGGKESEGKRLAVMQTMLSVCDSLKGVSENRAIISTGDFNDTPDGAAFKLVGDKLCNLALPFHQEGQGTLRYDGKWEIIDMFLVGPELEAACEMSVLQPPFLMVRDSSHPGMKPLRTYLGPRYLGGVSDHLPVLLVIGH